MPDLNEAAPVAAESAPVEVTQTTETTQAPASQTDGPAASTGTGRPKPAKEESHAEKRKALETSVRSKLDALSDDYEEPDSAPAAEEVTATAAAEATTEAGSPEEPTPAPEAASAVTPEPTLPAAHVRSLKAFGLSDAEIAKTSPEVAAALHSRRNQEITRWAEEGRKARNQNQPTQSPAAPVPPTPQPTTQKPAFDIAALKQQYGDEPLIAAIEAQQKELEAFRGHQSRWEADMQERQLQGLAKQVDGFFSNKELAAYQKTYGTDSSKLTVEQAEQRAKVLETADALAVYARNRGVNMTLDEAMQQAFDSVSAPLQKQVARQEITKALQPRAKGVSLKPGGRPAVAVPGNRRELQKSTKARLAEVFG